MKVIKNKIIPLGKKFSAINLFGIIFTKNDCTKEMLNHEAIHTRQMLELLILPFYVIYLVEWLFKLCKYKNNYLAYKNISFEREAYTNQSDLHYLEKRNPFNFIFYFSR